MPIPGLILAANNRLLMICLVEFLQPAVECCFLTRLASVDWFFMLKGDHILILSSSSRHELSIVSYFPPCEMHCWPHAKPNWWFSIHRCLSTCRTVSCLVYPMTCWKQQANMHTSAGQMTSQKPKQDVPEKVISCIISSERAENTVAGVG